jgi:hypothetical protein
MDRVVKAGGYDENRDRARLATPRASTTLNVYRLSVDVFVLSNTYGTAHVTAVGT